MRKKNLKLLTRMAEVGLPAYKVAKLAGIKPNTMSLIVNKKTDTPSDETMKGLCQVLKCNPSKIGFDDKRYVTDLSKSMKGKKIEIHEAAGTLFDMLNKEELPKRKSRQISWSLDQIVKNIVEIKNILGV